MASTASSESSRARSTPSMSAPSAAPVGSTSIPCRSNTTAISVSSSSKSTISSSIELHADGFGDKGRARGALDLDRVLRGDAHAAFYRLDRLDLLTQANARTGRHLPSKADPVGPVIEPARAVLDAIEGLAEARHQRQCQIAVRDRLAARHLALGALDIDMDPLVVASGIGEFIDQRLIDGKPIADADFLADILRKVRRP